MKNNWIIKASSLALCSSVGWAAQADDRPNIVLIMVDDMGYSDIGCYGGEILTPHIDRLAEKGVRYTQFYNTARSCPTRASLMTGLYPHQAGIGKMSEDPGSTAEQSEAKPFAYKGYLNRNSVTLAEVLKGAGYHTYMAGKWHLGMHGMEKWPLQRGFDRFYGILAGACSYLRPSGGRGLTLNNSNLPAPQGPYYTTDAFTDHAIGFIDENKDDENPFFLYLAYNAPHWPLHAKDADIEKFIGRYEEGWESISEKRFNRMVDMGIIQKEWGMGEWESRHWNELTEKERHDAALRMSVYAAQIHAVDYNIGKLIEYLEQHNKLENTLIIFLSDNGACAEPYSETGFGTIADINDPEKSVHPSYGLPWAQVSNTPFRKYKVRAYEGGISTPFILSWPAKYAQYDNQLRRNIAFLPDLMATFVDVSGATYPETYNGNKIFPMAGTSILPTVTQPETVIHDYLFGEHFDNRYVRNGQWKAVKDEKSENWELYNIEKDRSERYDLARQHPDILRRLVDRWDDWAAKTFIYSKE